MDRHFVVTGIILHNGRTLLIENPKLSRWFTPGGHLEPNEDPVQAVIREVAETTGLTCALLAETRFTHTAVQEVPVPFTIQLADAPENGGTVQHIDFIYVLRPVSDEDAVLSATAELDGWRWVPVAEVSGLQTAPELPDLIRGAARYAGE